MIIVFKDKKSQQYSETKSEGYKEKFALQFRLCVKSKLENDTKNKDSVDDGGDFKYDWIIRKIPALGRSTHLRTLPNYIMDRSTTTLSYQLGNVLTLR